MPNIIYWRAYNRAETCQMTMLATGDDAADEAALLVHCEQVDFPADWVQKCESWGSDPAQVHEDGKDKFRAHTCTYIHRLFEVEPPDTGRSIRAVSPGR